MNSMEIEMHEHMFTDVVVPIPTMILPEIDREAAKKKMDRSSYLTMIVQDFLLEEIDFLKGFKWGYALGVVTAFVCVIVGLGVAKL